MSDIEKIRAGIAMRNVDLMVGDLVTFKDCQNDEKPVIVKVMELHRYDDFILASIDGDKAYDELELNDEIVGIPLTPEILEKNGFETKDNAHFYSTGKIIELLLEEHPFIGYSIHWVKTIETINPIGQQCFLDYYIANLEYVHELQHALRLCGIDKEITVI